MRFLFLVPELTSHGGIQTLHRTMIRAMNTYICQVGGHMEVLTLNDVDLSRLLDTELSELSATHISACAANRVKFSSAAMRKILRADVVIYGLLAFAPLVFAQTIIAPHARRVLLTYGVDVWNRRSKVYGQAARLMTDVISISQYTLDRFREVYGMVAEQKSHVLPCSLDPVRSGCISFHDIKTKPIQQSDLQRLLSVSRLVKDEPGKGVDLVIEALPELLIDFPKLRYVVVGDGSDRMRLEDLARKLHVDHAVDFKGFVSETELEHEYSTCTLFTMPSASEGFGIVFVEAMAHGKPVIASSVGGTPEVVVDGKTGILVDRGDNISLVGAIRLLLNDADLRIKMGQAGIDRVQELYTFEVFTRHIRNIVDQLSG